MSTVRMEDCICLLSLVDIYILSIKVAVVWVIRVGFVIVGSRQFVKNMSSNF